MDLKSKRCVPCEGGVPKLAGETVCALLRDVSGWTETDDKIHKAFTHKNFVEAMAFVNRVAEVAEAEGHHPDFCVHYSRVDVTIWTHAVGGLTENDFILAAKIDALSGC
ncbi:MAG: 4a-hydroxytetrahydrobiopterin dehydratase [Deltaproteobacteria bacterium]|nr:4a-hydroxytetrahydrobiopterin dehydratase [Deltaproteobacteria bacterium]